MSTDARKLSCFQSLLDAPAVESVGRMTDDGAADLPAADVAAQSDAGQAAEDAAPMSAEATDASTVPAESATDAQIQVVNDAEGADVPPADFAEARSPSSIQAAAASAQSVAQSAPTEAAADAADPPSALPEVVDAPLETPGTLSDDFGREHVANVADEPEERVTATVTNVTRDYTKRLVFQFENGQVWRQQEARRFQYPKDRAFNVVIARGVFGDYQMRVNGEGRMTRIKRLQ